jgi:hypothetical protein
MNINLYSRKLIIPAGILDARGIMTIRRSDRMNPVTFRTLAHKGYQSKVGATSLAFGGQAAIGNKLISNPAAMGIINKLNKFAADRKGTAAASAATTFSHNYTSKLLSYNPDNFSRY